MLTFHHLGIASRDLDSDLDALTSLGYSSTGVDFVDPAQGVRGRFLQGPGPQLELLEQLPGSQVLEGWLTRGIRIYHQAFVANAFDAEVERLRSRGAIVVSGPTPAVAFDGRLICFIMLKERMLIELIADR